MRARADLHAHSCHSNRPDEWWLHRISTPESFTDPRDLYRARRARGMDFVTVTDHDTAAGALGIACLSGVLDSSMPGARRRGVGGAETSAAQALWAAAAGP